MLFKASAPGSLMLLGEYAVLEDKLAIVCAVNKRMTVSLTPRKDSSIVITSALGNLKIDLTQLEIKSPFQFVLAALKRFQDKMKSGCDLEIVSEFSDKIGFASSAAVTVATLSALFKWLKISLTQTEFVMTARSIIREVQGIGSGADAAACIMGGIVAYQADPLIIEPLFHVHPITVIYSGSKTPTTEAIRFVEKKFANQPEYYKRILQAIHACAEGGKEAIKNHDWMKLGSEMNKQQTLMEELGVSTPELNNIIAELRTHPSILGAKISGSGLGDCVIGLGTTSKEINEIDVSIAEEGVFCEEI